MATETLQLDEFGRGKVNTQPVVGIVMGSWTDWDVMHAAVKVCDELEISVEAGVVSAHRTPHLLVQYAERARELHFVAVIAGAGGAAHLPGLLAAFLPDIPVIGVPVKTSALGGQDSLLSIVQMPPEVPVATMAINGAANAALLAAQIYARTTEGALFASRLRARRQYFSELVTQNPDPEQDPRSDDFAKQKAADAVRGNFGRFGVRAFEGLTFP